MPFLLMGNYSQSKCEHSMILVYGLQVSRELREAARVGAQENSGAGVGVHESLLAQPTVSEHFLGLLCQFDPTAALPFLQSHDSYRSAACLTLNSLFVHVAALLH